MKLQRTFERSWPLLLPLAALGFTFLLYSLSRIFGGAGLECGFQTLFGLHCPGCGGTRCAKALGSGDVLQAWNHNALLTLGVILFASGSLYLIIRITILGKTAPSLPPLNRRWLWAGGAGVILFTILRNTDTFASLAP